MKTRTPIATGSALALLSVIAAHGAAISVTFNANRTLAPTDVTGAEAAVGNWNNILVTGGNHNGTWGSLQDSTGAATTASITTASWGGVISMSTDGTPFIKLYEAGIAREGDVPVAVSPTITLSDIPYAAYDVYIYYTHFPIGSDTLQTWTESQNNTTLYGTNNKNHGHDWGTFVQYQTADRATAVAQATIGSPEGGGNWLKFTNLTASTLTLTSSDQNFPDITGYKQRGIAGLQIVQVPEPGAAMLLALAGCAVAVRRRRA